MYVTLLSNTSKSEFPNNKPNSFKVRLAHPLKVKEWQVGLASIYLPVVEHEEKHAVTAHLPKKKKKLRYSPSQKGDNINCMIDRPITFYFNYMDKL